MPRPELFLPGYGAAREAAAVSVRRDEVGDRPVHPVRSRRREWRRRQFGQPAATPMATESATRAKPSSRALACPALPAAADGRVGECGRRTLGRESTSMPIIPAARHPQPPQGGVRFRDDSGGDAFLQPVSPSTTQLVLRGDGRFPGEALAARQVLRLGIGDTCFTAPLLPK